MLWILTIIFGILSIIFFMGKGSFLIAGYNTASQKEKNQYHEKKLCHVMGIGCLILACSFLVGELNDDFGPYVIVIGVIVSMFVFVIGGSLSSIERHFFKRLVLPLIGCTLFCGFLLFMMFSGDISIEMHDDFIKADASMSASYDVYYQDIHEISLREDLDIGKRVGGVGNLTVNAGRFENQEFGEYKLYSYVKCHEFVVVDTKYGYLVFNGKNENETVELYNQLKIKTQSFD